jgi:hypothetical protein
MAFPSSLDTFSNPQGTTLLSPDDHANQHRTEGSAIVGLENKVGLSVGTPVINKILVGSGNGTSIWSQTWNAGTLGTAIINNSTLGTPSISGGTITDILITTKTIGSSALTGTINGTFTLDLAVASRFLITLPNSAGPVTLAVNNVVVNKPFIAEILQGTAGNGTVTFFTTIRWAGSAAPTQTLTASRKDTFGFIPTSGTSFDGYIVGQNL